MNRIDNIEQVKNRLPLEVKKRFELISACMMLNTITIKRLIINLRSFINIIEKETIGDFLVPIKDARRWICHNMIDVLHRRLINPNATKEICDYIQQYSYILEIYRSLHIFLPNTSQYMEEICWLICVFFTIDIEFSNKSFSQYEITKYIIDNNPTAVKLTNISNKIGNDEPPSYTDTDTKFNNDNCYVDNLNNVIKYEELYG